MKPKENNLPVIYGGIVLFIVLVLVYILLIGLMISGDVSGFLLNVGTEGISIIITAVVIDQLVKMREKKRIQPIENQIYRRLLSITEVYFLPWSHFLLDREGIEKSMVMLNYGKVQRHCFCAFSIDPTLEQYFRNDAIDVVFKDDNKPKREKIIKMMLTSLNNFRVQLRTFMDSNSHLISEEIVFEKLLELENHVAEIDNAGYIVEGYQIEDYQGVRMLRISMDSMIELVVDLRIELEKVADECQIIPSVIMR